MIAQRAVPPPPVSLERRFEMRDLWRVALWGTMAAGAVLLAVFAGTTDRGNDRLIAAATHLRLVPPAPAPVAQAAPPPTESAESKQLAETVKSLAADRDRLVARLNSLERTLDVTSAVPRAPELPLVQASTPPAPPPQVAMPETVTVQTVMPRPAPQVQTAPLQTQAAVTPEPTEAVIAPAPATPTRAQFGVDLGSSTTVEGLRVLWTNAKSKYGGLLEGLRPVMTVRDHARPGGVELRLIAGPVANAAAAARLCSAMAGAFCQPSVYEGQRLALR